MADRFPLVVNNTTNQITEVFSGDNLLFDNTQLITSTGNLVLNPANDIDFQKDIINSQGDVKIDDDLEITQRLAVGTTLGAGTDIRIGRTWNNSAVTFMGIDMDITPTSIGAASRLVRLRNTGVDRFTIDVDGNTRTWGTLTVDGATTLSSTLNVVGAVDFDSTLNVDGNTTLVGTLGVTGNTTLTTLTTSSSLTVTGLATFNSAIDANSTLNVQGAATFQDGIYPDTDEGASIGSSSLPWGVAHIGEITIAAGGTNNDDNTISTATGDLYLTSTGGNVNITGQVSITHTGQDNNLRLISTDAGAYAGPDLVLWRNSATPATGDEIGSIKFAGNDSALNETLYGRIYTVATDVVDGTENGKFVFDVINGGANTQAMSITGAGVTIEGNLTVQGTQTILNTSTLQVEDNTIELRKGTSITAADGGVQVNLTTDSNGAVTSYQQLLWDNSDTSWRTYDGTNYSSLVTERRNNDITGTLTVHSMLEDADYVTGAAPAATQDFSLRASNVKWFSVNATTDFTLNFKADASETLDSMMGVTEVATATCVVTNGGTAYKIGSVTVDGSAPTSILWANGTSYPNGTVNAADVYVFTIIKTGSAAFTILASQSTFS
jgi:hypothetical protein